MRALRVPSPSAERPSAWLFIAGPAPRLDVCVRLTVYLWQRRAAFALRPAGGSRVTSGGGDISAAFLNSR